MRIKQKSWGFPTTEASDWPFCVACPRHGVISLAGTAGNGRGGHRPVQLDIEIPQGSYYCMAHSYKNSLVFRINSMR